MKITIDYNGAFAVCDIEPMEEPGKMVNFNESDTKSQTFALSAFRCIEEHWKREKYLEQYKNHPVMHIKREIQVRFQNFDILSELSSKGVIISWTYDQSSDPTISVLLNDGHTTVTDFGWLLEDTEGRWWGMDNGYHRILMEYNKIVIG